MNITHFTVYKIIRFLTYAAIAIIAAGAGYVGLVTNEEGYSLEYSSTNMNAKADIPHTTPPVEPSWSSGGDDSC